MIECTFQMINFEQLAVFQNCDDIKAHLNIKPEFGNIMVGGRYQKLYLLFSDGIGNIYNLIIASCPYLYNSQYSILFGNNIYFGFEVVVVTISYVIAFLNQKIDRYRLPLFSKFIVITHFPAVNVKKVYFIEKIRS